MTRRHKLDQYNFLSIWIFRDDGEAVSLLLIELSKTSLNKRYYFGKSYRKAKKTYAISSLIITYF